MTVFLPDAEDLNVSAIRPTARFRDSSPDIDNRGLIDKRYEADGYLFFRDLLPKEAIAATRDEMLAPLVQQGLTDKDGVWTGGDRASFTETAPEFNGVWRRLFERPCVREAFQRLLGEPASPVPIVQYRAYPPRDSFGGVHQDGFYSPGITGYRPVWIPLVPMDEDVGGLMLAVGQTNKGYFHNTAKAPPYPIPAGMIPDSAWAWIDYRPGDVLVIHPDSPHTGMPNRSRRVRLSLDARVQSAANPATVVGRLTSITPEAVVLELEEGGASRLSLTEDTFIRAGVNAGVRLSREEFARSDSLGVRVLVAKDGDRAVMLRRATDA